MINQSYKQTLKSYLEVAGKRPEVEPPFDIYNREYDEDLVHFESPWCSRDLHPTKTTISDTDAEYLPVAYHAFPEVVEKLLVAIEELEQSCFCELRRNSNFCELLNKCATCEALSKILGEE